MCDVNARSTAKCIRGRGTSWNAPKVRAAVKHSSWFAANMSCVNSLAVVASISMPGESFAHTKHFLGLTLRKCAAGKVTSTKFWGMYCKYFVAAGNFFCASSYQEWNGNFQRCFNAMLQVASKMRFESLKSMKPVLINQPIALPIFSDDQMFIRLQPSSLRLPVSHLLFWVCHPLFSA